MSDIQTSPDTAVRPASALQNFNLKDVWSSPGVRQLAALIGVALAVAVGVTIFMWGQKPGMQTLYSGLNTQDEAAMVEALRQAGIEFSQQPGGAIQVAAGDVHSARLQLASQGLPRSAGGGFETMREEQGIGVSQFLENARYQHALETELSRTISQLQPVRSARVHLAIPQRSAFVRNRQQPSASVLLALYPGRRLEDGQVDAVVHLVASSIPELQASKVSVVDEAGRLLNRSGDSAMGLSTTQLEYRTRLEDSYRGRIEQLLLPVLGPGRVSAQVSVDLDFSALEETRESYAPDGKVLRSEQLSENRDVTAEAVGVPGALSNRVPNSDQNDDTDLATSRQQTRNYEVDRTLSHRRSDPGRLRRVSVAVLVDHVPDLEAGGDSTKPLAAGELAQIENLVKDAVGFDAERGDTVSISNLSFVTPQALAPVDEPMWDTPLVRNLGRQLLGAAVLLIIAFVVLRPALRAALNPPYPVREVGPAALGASAPMAAASADGQMQAQTLADEQEAPRSAALPPMERKLNVARDAVREDPKRVAQLMKQWVGDD